MNEDHKNVLYLLERLNIFKKMSSETVIKLTFSRFNYFSSVLIYIIHSYFIIQQSTNH